VIKTKKKVMMKSLGFKRKQEMKEWDLDYDRGKLGQRRGR
jgi:hypothetical protein